MDFESTASQQLHRQLLQDENPVANYLINTSKAVKGHKLKTEDFIKLQLMKFRRCSPAKYEQFLEGQIKNTQPVEYTKYKGFESAKEEEIMMFVNAQRQKISRETKGRIKLFNNSKINSIIEEPSAALNQNISLRVKPATSGHSRSNQKPVASHSKTIANDTVSRHFYGSTRPARNMMIFRSDNLGGQMNDYLNFYLAGERGDGGERRELESEQKEQVVREASRVRLEERHSQTIDVLRKRPNLAFVRRMKKHHRNRADQTRIENFSQFRSQQLVKPTTTNPVPKMQRQVFTQNRQR